MSDVHAQVLLPPALPLDETRGTGGMLLFILSEAILFACLFFSYFYLGRDEPRWPMHPPPKLTLATIMLGVLMVSSVVMYLGEEWARQGREGTARLAVVGTLLLGLIFVGLQALEYRNHLQELKPTTDAYGSIFYTITSFHGLHLLLGLGMLTYVLFLPSLEHADTPPHRALHNTALYWHFVDLVWVFIFAFFYLW